MKAHSFRASLGFAVAGLKAAWLRERNFRIHCRAALAVAVLLIVLRPPLIWWAAIALTVALVFILELINSALEGLIDLLHPGIHPEIKIIKDMMAGAVLIAAIASVVVGIAMLWAVGWPTVKEWL